MTWMMSRIRLATLVAPFVVSVAMTAAAREAQPPGSGVPSSIGYFERVTHVSTNAAGAAGQAGRTKGRSRLEVSFHTLGKDFNLELTPNHSLFAPNAKNVWIDDAGVVEEKPQRVFYRGRVKGEADSWVRVKVEHGTLDGMIWTPDEVYFIEPAARFFDDAPAGEMITYRLSDTESDWTPDSCAVQDVPRHRQRKAGGSGVRSKGMAAYQALASALQEVAPAATAEKAEVSLVADYEYFLRHGGASATFMQNVINQVDGVYQREVGVTVQVLQTVVYSTSSDPFTNTTVPNTLLNEFSTFKNNNDNSPGQLLYGCDLAQLFTGRDLDSTVIGIAWLGSLCSSYYGSSLVQDYTSNNNALVMLSSHEVGHNFSAPHDNQSGSACSYEPYGYIMNPSIFAVSSLDQLHFSGCSKSHITSEAGGAACLDSVSAGTPTATPAPAPTPTPGIVLNPLASPIVVGGAVTLTGSGFTAGSVIKMFVAMATGTVGYGPFTPSSWTPTSLVWQVPATIALGKGFATVEVINTDQGYIKSNTVAQLLYGNPGSNIPTIKAINGVSLQGDLKVPLAYVETVVEPGAVMTLTGSGFSGALVNVFTSVGDVGPLAPLAGATSMRLEVVVPAGAPTGPGSIRVVNSPYVGNVASNLVAVPIGAGITIDSVTQELTTIRVMGTGFSLLTVINFYNTQGGGVVNLGGRDSQGQPKIPLTMISDEEFTFTVPAAAVTGAAFVVAINPPYIAYTSTGNDPDGGVQLVVP